MRLTGGEEQALERKGKERKGKERKGKGRKGKGRTEGTEHWALDTGPRQQARIITVRARYIKDYCTYQDVYVRVQYKHTLL